MQKSTYLSSTKPLTVYCRSDKIGRWDIEFFVLWVNSHFSVALGLEMLWNMPGLGRWPDMISAQYISDFCLWIGLTVLMLPLMGIGHILSVVSMIHWTTVEWKSHSHSTSYVCVK